MIFIKTVLLSLILVLGCSCSFAEGDEWVCADCGAANTTNFCIKCGAKKPEEIVCPDCGTKHPIDSGAVFCGNCGAKLQRDASISIKYEGKGFGTPEEALTCYMEGLKNLDFEQMLSAFAWETQMAHYDFKAYFERIRAYQPTMRPRMPSTNDFMFSANVNILRFNQADLIYRSLEQYILGIDSPSKQTTGSIIFQMLLRANSPLKITRKASSSKQHAMALMKRSISSVSQILVVKHFIAVRQSAATETNGILSLSAV